MKTRITTRSLLLLAAAAHLGISASSAATYYWDLDGATTAGAGASSPNGTWASSSLFWSTDPLGGTSTSATTTTSSDDLFFSAGTNATGTYTITLLTTQAARSLTFEEGSTITIQGASGVITLGGTGDINVATGRAVNIGNAFTTKIDGTAGLTKLGGGTLTLSGSAVNTFTGGLRLNGGTLALSFANLGTPTDLIENSNALSFGGGLMTILGKNSGNTAQTFAGTTVGVGGGSLLVNPNNGTGTTVTLGSLGTLSSWATGSSLALGRALSAGTGTLAITTTTDKDATGIYGGRIVYASGTASTGYDWATNTGGAGPTYTLGSYTGYTTLPANTGSSTTNYDISGGITLDGNLAANTLKITGSATALDLGANTLTLKSGGLLSVGSTAQIISGTAGGTRLTAGSGNGGTEDLVIYQYNTAATSGSNTGLVISAVIGDNTAGSGNAVNLVKTGLNTLALQGANTYTGDTFINAGTLVIGSPSNTQVAGSLGNGSYGGNISIASGAQLAVRSNVNQALSGVISGDGTLFKGGPGILTLSGNNTYTGATTVAPTYAGNTSTLIVSSFNSVGTGAGYAPRASSSLGAPTTVANGTITLGQATRGTGYLVYNGAGETTDRVLNFVFNSSGSHKLEASGTGLLKFTSDFTGSGGSTPSGALIITGTGAGEIAGNIPAFYSGAKLTKEGTGIWTLSGTNNAYTGLTSVTGGTLNVTGNLTTSAVTVENNATLSGTGTTGGTLTLNNGSTIVGTTAGSSFQASSVTANASVKIAGSSGSGKLGNHAIGVVRYTGTAPTIGNFSTAGYRTVISLVNSASPGPGETLLTYTNAGRTWNSASGTWDAMSTTSWQEGDFKYSQGDVVTFDDSGTGGGSARAVTLSSLVTPGSVTFNNSTTTPYTVSGTGSIGGLSGLTKSGTGTLTLSTVNTYSGATAVNGGKLLVQNGSILNSAVTVSGSGTILATGTSSWLGKAVAIDNGAILAAGDRGTVGTAFLGDATTFNNGSVFSWDVGTTGTAYDKVVSAGGLVDGNAVGGSVFQIVVADSGFSNGFWDTNQTWTDIFTSNTTTAIANWGAIFGNTVSVVNSSFGTITPVGGSFSLSGSTLSWTAVPEPSTALGGLLLTAGLLRRRRKMA